MLFRLTLRSIGPQRGTGRARFTRAAASVFMLVLVELSSTPAAAAGSGSGTARIIQPDSCVVASKHQWTIEYDPSEDFGNPQGGVLEIRIPNGWSPPQRTSSTSPGYVDYTNATVVTSISISGQVIRLVLGAGPPATKKFLATDLISVLYGVGGPASLAVADTIAGRARFAVSSDPQNTGTLDTLAAGSPRVRVLPDTVAVIKIADGAGSEVGGLGRTTDQDTTRFYLRGYDRYGNAARFVNGAWRVSGGIGLLADSTTSSRRLVLTTVGVGKVYADSGSWHDSTGAITVLHGLYAGLRMTSSTTATAGGSSAATVEARDADGNRITNDVGSAALVRMVGYADSLGSTVADPSFTNPYATLSAGFWSGTLTPLRSGTFFLAARDSVAVLESAPRARLSVSPSAPNHLEIQPDTLRLVAGVPDTLTIVSRDVFGNRAPFTATEEVTLWTDRPQGRFENLLGSPIFTASIPAGLDSVAVRFVDTQRTSSPGRVRAIDANGIAPFVGAADAAVVTAPAAPAGTIVWTVTPDTLVANGVDSAFVRSGPVRDLFGNVVLAGERFTITAAGVVPITDVDAGAPGIQWTVGADSTVSGRVRAGTVAGTGSVSGTSERGTASGATLVRLIPGPPAGTIALTASPDSVAADGLSTRLIAAAGLVDALANRVLDGEAYTVSTTLGSIATADVDPGTPGVQVRATAGAISFELLGGSVLGTAVVSAASVRGSATGSVNVRLVPGAVSPDSSTVAATTPVTVGSPGSAVTVTLRDRRGHPLAGVPSAAIAVTASGVATVVTPGSGATNAGGSIVYAVSATSAGSATLSVVARGVPLAWQPVVQFLHGSLDTLVVTGPAGPLTSGVADSIAVEARDRYGNPMADRSDLLHPTITSGAATGLPVSVSLTAGRVTLSFTPTLAAPLTLRLADDSSHATTYGPVAVNAGPPYRLAADPLPSDTLQAGASVAVRALVFDANGNASPGDTVLASIVEGGGSVTPGISVTDGAGTVTVSLSAGAAPGPLTLRLLASGSAAPEAVRSDSVQATVVPAGAASVAIAAAASAVAGTPLDVTLTLRDAFGNVATGAVPTLQLDTSSSLPDSVTWSLGAGAAGALNDNPADDRAAYSFAAADSGTATLRVRFTRAETVRVTVSGLGPGAQSGDVVVVPATAARLVVAGGQGQSAIVDRELAQPLQVEARDAFGNLVPGAGVAFRVRAGGGSLDVVRGAPADSNAVTDGAGIARCEVVRLGMLAGAGNNRIAALLAPAADSVLFVASALPDTTASLSLAPPSLSLAPGGIATVTATARDRFANPVPGAAVTFYLGSSPAGSLSSRGPTTGTGTAQAGVTNATGTLDVDYHAPTTAPASDLLYARGTSVGPVSLSVTVAPSAVDSLAVLPDAASWTAGSAVRVRVRALDASGNVAVSDTSTVVMGPTVPGLSFAPAFGPISGGEFVTFATATTAGNLTVTARIASIAAPFVSGPIAVAPAAPAGAIPIAAGRDTLTADGRSTTTIVFGPVLDPYGNTVAAGTLLTVGADSLVAADASPATGLQIATAVDDRARAVLVAPSVPGTGMVRAVSVAGTARDSLEIVYLARPSLVLSGTPSPSVVVPGQSVSFALDITNGAASGPVTIATGSVFSFGSGGTAFTASPSASFTIPAGATRTLTTPATLVPSGMLPGTYAPSLHLIGTDATGAPLDFYLALAGAQVHVAGIRVAAVGAAPDPVPLGSSSLSLTFRVDNLAAAPATIDAIALAPSTLTINGMSPPLPAALGALGSTTLTLSVSVPASGIPPGTNVDATLAASVSYGAVAVNGTTTTPLRFQVISAAALVAQSGGTSPSRYLRDRVFGSAARIANTGSAPVTLSPGATRLLLDRGATRLETGLTAATAVPGSGVANLLFDSLAVPSGAPLGRYAARLILSGTEAGQAFADTIPLAPDSLDVLDPALLAITGGLAPDRVSSGQTRPLQLTVRNDGDVSFVIDAATRLTLGAPASVTLAPMTTGPVPAHGSLTVTFAASPLGSPSGSAGSAPALLEARGTEDGRVRAEALDAGALNVEAPARLAFVGGSTAPDTVRAGQTVPLSLSIRNDGGSPFLVDPAATTLLVTDGVETATASASGPSFALDPGGSATLAFPAVAFPAALASQPYPVALDVAGTEWGLAETIALVSPAGELRLVEPVPALQVRGIDPGTPVQAAAEDDAVPIWSLELTPLVPAGGSTSAHLDAVSFTVLVDGTASTNASAALAQIAVRDDQGTLLATAAPAAGAKTTLVLTTPLVLTGAVVTLRVEATLRAGTTAASVALRVADAGDIDARDDLTQAPVPVRAAGGLPFEPLTSPTITLFAKPHGYPNPFHAGREEVRLSYRLLADASVHVTIYTLLGDVVRELSLAAGSPGGLRGLNEVPWDGRNGGGDTVRPGVYVARIEGGGVSERIKVGVLR